MKMLIDFGIGEIAPFQSKQLKEADGY